MAQKKYDKPANITIARTDYLAVSLRTLALLHKYQDYQVHRQVIMLIDSRRSAAYR